MSKNINQNVNKYGRSILGFILKGVSTLVVAFVVFYVILFIVVGNMMYNDEAMVAQRIEGYSYSQCFSSGYRFYDGYCHVR